MCHGSTWGRRPRRKRGTSDEQREGRYRLGRTNILFVQSGSYKLPCDESGYIVSLNFFEAPIRAKLTKPSAKM